MAYNPRDSYFKKAKLEGYRSRAAYKLIELHQRFRLLRPGDAVVDLGAAPGGWLQVAAKAVGPNGKVIGVDLQAIKPFNERNISLLEGDITTAGIQAKIKELIGAPADSILSDLAPKLSGIRDADMARCLELNRTALQVAAELLRPSLVAIKSFISGLKIYSGTHANFSSVQRTNGIPRQVHRNLFLRQGISARAGGSKKRPLGHRVVHSVQKDPVTGRWVVIASERAKRPQHQNVTGPSAGLEPCPFCAGNEAMTPAEVLAYRDARARPNSPGWRVRLVPNKYPAFEASAVWQTQTDGLYYR